MKRFHVHLHVDDLSRSMVFYSRLFAAEPARVESDYAKWMLDEPALNFAISTRGGAQPGIDHLGFQTDDPDELATMKANAEAAGLALRDDGLTTCCYARSEKHWITDPQGIAWEHFQSVAQIPVYREAPAATTAGEPRSACCAATANVMTAAPAVHAASAAPAVYAAPAATPSSCCGALLR